MKLIYGHKTPAGPVFIGQSPDGRFHPIWEDESLGSYHSAIAAMEDLSGGHTFTPSDGTDMGALGISADPGDWVAARSLM